MERQGKHGEGILNVSIYSCFFFIVTQVHDISFDCCGLLIKDSCFQFTHCQIEGARLSRPGSSFYFFSFKNSLVDLVSDSLFPSLSLLTFTSKKE